MGSLDGKVAIVTGVSGGIGAATAARLVEEGARVLLVDREEDALRGVAEQIGTDRVGWVVADVAAEADAKRYVQAAVERFGGVDVLFANAGTEGRVRPLVEQEVGDFERVLAVNVTGVWLGIKHAAPHIAARGGGSIVVTSSVGGLVGARGLGAYCASKHAVLGLVKTAAQELAALGIRVNAVNPGPIENRMMRSIEEQAAPGAAAAVKKGFEAMVPLGRYGTNEEIASAVLFLASDASSFCTGTTLVADGGLLTQ